MTLPPEQSEALLELAARVEAASEGTPMLEAEIGALMHAAGWHVADCMRQFTRSIDAAMTLLNKYGVLLHLSDIGADGLALCHVGDCWTSHIYKGVGTANLALAIVAASLRCQAAALRSLALQPGGE